MERGLQWVERWGGVVLGCIWVFACQFKPETPAVDYQSTALDRLTTSEEVHAFLVRLDSNYAHFRINTDLVFTDQ